MPGSRQANLTIQRADHSYAESGIFKNSNMVPGIWQATTDLANVFFSTALREEGLNAVDNDTPEQSSLTAL